MSTTSQQLLTEDDLLRLPNDHMRHELVRGELRTMPPTGGEHGTVVVNLTVPLAQFVKARQLGRVFGAETGFTIARNPDTVRAPDLAFVTASRVSSIGISKKFVSGPPDLAIEVVSPGDTVNEVDEKVQDWLGAGVRLVWIVNPEPRTVTVYATGQPPRILSETEQIDGGDVIPGFRLPIHEIFA